MPSHSEMSFKFTVVIKCEILMNGNMFVFFPCFFFLNEIFGIIFRNMYDEEISETHKNGFNFMYCLVST